LDLGLVPLNRPALWLLGAPTQIAQETAHVVHVIRYAEAIADELGHTRASPQIRREPGGPGALEQDSLEALPGPGIQLRRTAGSRFRPQAIVTRFSVDAVPAPNAAPVDADQVRYLEGLMALQEKPDGTNSTTLQFLWASGRSHGLPPAQGIGH
jgi:hypothetical protein